MSPSPQPREAKCPRFPRVSGDEPKITADGEYPYGFSPRERG